MDKSSRIVVTGAAGLLGQNLVLLLRESGYNNLLAIDKHPQHLAKLRELHPDLDILEQDLAKPGEWASRFADADVVLQLHAQITGLHEDVFIRNNIEATKNVLDVIKKQQIPYLVHISSSVVNSVADDFYTKTKTKQEQIVDQSEIEHCTLRPTLMFGWFDPKHLGWLSRFMSKTPVFPVPGNGKFVRQPLYARDFCRVIIRAMEKRMHGTYDIVGQEKITYIDMLKLIKKAKQLKTKIWCIPYGLFSGLLGLYAVFNKKPPFTRQQLKALTAGDIFEGVDPKAIFDLDFTPLQAAVAETYTDPKYSKILLER